MMLQGCKLNRRFSLLIVVGLIVVVAAALLAVLYENGFLTNSTETEPTILWQSGIENFATDFVVADGKVFASDNWGNVYCFDAQSGESVWTASVGGFVAAGSTIEVYEGKVYVGCRGSVVNRLDENTGKLELTFQAPVSTSYGSKSAPDFFVADGRVFASQNGMAVYNASNGELFWGSFSFSSITLGNASTSAPESDYVFIWYNSRVNPNNGSIMWNIPGDSSDPAIVTQGKVLFWNYNPVGISDDGQTVLCVDASSRDTLWSFDVGARMFQPNVFNGLVLFGAEDGYFYAVNFADGSLEWRTFVDDQNLIETFNSYTEMQQSIIDMRASSVQVDPQDQTVFWSVIVGYNGDDVYNGTLWSLDLLNGDRIWTLPVTSNGSVFTNYAAYASVTLSNNLLYVTEHSDLYCLSAHTGEIQFRRNFEHYVLPPTAEDNRVFVAADLWVFAYE
jgi:outer membrane protein assembly factor BamB